MITNSLKLDDVRDNRGLAHILSKVNYVNIQSGLASSKRVPHETNVVLFEYANSPVGRIIATVERLPDCGTTIDEFLRKPDVWNMLKSLFEGEGMSLYIRRKVDYDAGVAEEGYLTDYRQVILRIPSECPALPF